MSNQHEPAPKGPPPPAKESSRGKLVAYDEFIEAELRRTRGHVRSVDLAAGLMMLAAGTLAYFFLAANVDHWLIPGGLGFWGRLAFLLIYTAGVIYGYVIVHMIPLFTRRINPVYAAHTIERSRPSLKNALVNFLLLRADPAGVNPAVFRAVEEQAATNLARMPGEAAVDRSKLIHIGYALLGILIVCAAYAVLSPKNLFDSIHRLVVPWADIEVPTRTSIVEIEPGDVETFRGQQVTVKARIERLRGDGKVMLFFSTADGQMVDRGVEMRLSGEGYKHTCVLPADDAALQQSLTYRIEAGDAVSKTYKIRVVAAPTIVVQAVRYKYPAYTGLLERRVEHQGDIKAIEQTEVTIEAVANQDIQSAWIDFDADNTIDKRILVEGQQAHGSFRLTLKDDRRTPEYRSYQLMFRDTQGRQNPQPLRHEIEVTRDVAPEIQFVAPGPDDVELPLNAAADLELVAQDPDFALHLVKLSASTSAGPLFDKLLLSETRSGQFVHKFHFEPARFGLKAGDVVEYWAAAEDNKDPQPNHSETGKRRIRIVAPSGTSKEDRVARNSSRGGRGGSSAPGDGHSGGDQPGDGQGAAGQGDKGDDAPANGKSSPSTPGDAGGSRGKNAGAADDKSTDNDGQQDHQGAQGREQEKSVNAPDNSNRPEKSNQRSSADKTSNERDQGKSADQPTDQQAVPSDGSDDADAFERILKHRDEQEKSPQKSPEERKPNEQQRDDQQRQEPSSGDGSGADKSQARKPSDSSSRDSSSSQPQGKQQAGKPQDKQQSGRSEDRSGSASKSSGDKKQDTQQPGQPPNQAKDQSRSDQQKGDNQSPRDAKDDQKKRGQKSESKGDKSSSKKQERSQDKQGQTGAGRNGQEEQNQAGSGEPADGQQGTKGDKGKSSANQQDELSKQPGKNDQSPTKAPRDTGDAADQQHGQGDKPSSDKPSGDQPAGKDASTDPAASQDPASQGTSGQSADKPQSAKDKQGQTPKGDTAEDKQQGAAQAKDDDAAPRANQGKGAKAKDDPTGKQSRPKSTPDSQKPDARGGDGEKEKGPSGAGQPSDENRGSPNATEENQPRDKAQRDAPSEKDTKKDSSPQSPSNSSRESDSQGASDGDRSGGGRRGGGQKSNTAGTGRAGENTASDEGTGRANEAGDGETSDRAGKDRKADHSTGQTGKGPGSGSSKQSAAGDGGKPGGETDPGQGTPRSGTGQSSNTSGEGEQSGDDGTVPTRGGESSPTKDQTWRPTPDKADEANLEYARKATDLALAHLRDELKKDRPDPQLLDRLGWTKDDLANFVRRWEQMRSQATDGGDQGTAARRQLDDALRSLGLRPRATSMGRNAARDDQSRGYKESRRTSPPPEYAEQYKAYTQGTARGGK